jgi:hypothetical protein
VLSARSAGAAADLEGHDNLLADPYVRHVGADLHHLGNALVTEMEREREGRPTEQDGPVAIAGCHGQRTDDGTGWIRAARRGKAPPTQTPAG